MSKPKKPVRSKEQIIHDEAVIKETARQRKIVSEQLMPILLKYSTNIENAKFNLNVVINSLTSAFQKLVANEQSRLSGEHISTISSDIMGQIAIMKSGDKDGMISDACVNDLLFLFKDEPMGTADTLMRGMVGEIDASVKEECLTRGFDTLKLTIL
jgi:hypothetical protein